MAMFRALACFLPLAFFAIITPAAAGIDAEGAAKLKGVFENFIANQKNMGNLSSGGAIEYDGQVSVEPSENYYAVTLPHARIRYQDGSQFDIGMISVNASPHSAPGQWKMAMAIPTPAVLKDASGQPSLKVSIAGQKAIGVWDEALEGFAKLDAQYSDIVIEDARKNFTLRFPKTSALYDFEKDANGLWSGPGSMVMSNIEGIFGPEKTSGKIAEFKVEFSTDRYNPAVLKEYRTKVAGLLASAAAQPPSAAGEPEVLDAAQSSELANQLTNLILSSANAIAAQYSISGLEFSRINPETKAPQTMKIAEAFLGMDAKGFFSDKVSMNLRLGHDGFEINPVPPGYEGVLPSGVNINLAFDEIPARQLAELGKNAALGAAQDPQIAGMAALSYLFKIPAILSQAGTTMSVKENYVVGDGYRFDLNGSARADINAVNNFTGEFKGVFRGMDKLIERVQAIASDPNNPEAQNAQNISMSLMAMKATGKPEQGADGQTTYVYDFLITSQGQMLLNGQPALGGVPAPGAMPQPLSAP